MSTMTQTPTRWQEIKTIFDFYPIQMKYATIITAQYPLAAFLWLISLVVEPTIYLVVWSTIAREQGGVVGGYTAGGFAAYYIAWTAVRVMNISLTPWAFESRVQRGEWSPMLVRPLHPFHQDLAFFIGMKARDMVYLIPIMGLLIIAFKPELHPTWWQIAGFVVAIFTGFVMRFIWLWLLGLITFWITRISAVFDLYFAIELLLSGRVVPIDLLPQWAQNVAGWLPYQWSFGFPIELVLGRLTVQETLAGLGMQLLWAMIGWILLMILWRQGVKQYSAVGA